MQCLNKYKSATNLFISIRRLLLLLVLLVVVVIAVLLLPLLSVVINTNSIVYDNHMHGRIEADAERRKVRKWTAFPFLHLHRYYAEWAAVCVAVAQWTYEWDMGGQNIYKTNQATSIFQSTHTAHSTQHTANIDIYLDSSNATTFPAIPVPVHILIYITHSNSHSLLYCTCICTVSEHFTYLFIIKVCKAEIQ